MRPQHNLCRPWVAARMQAGPLLTPCPPNPTTTRAVDDHDRVALNSMKFASAQSAGAGSRVISGSATNGHAGSGPALMTASMDQMTIPLPPWTIRAGARREIFFDPKQVTAAVVTCGGLCPGLNDVVAGIVNKLTVSTHCLLHVVCL